MTNRTEEAPRVFGLLGVRRDGGWHWAFGALHYEIRDTQPNIEPRSITWLHSDVPGALVRIAGRSVPKLGTNNECARAIEAELSAIADATNAARAAQGEKT